MVNNFNLLTCKDEHVIVKLMLVDAMERERGGIMSLVLKFQNGLF
jgi:hypothetical protein